MKTQTFLAAKINNMNKITEITPKPRSRRNIIRKNMESKNIQGIQGISHHTSSKF